MGIAPGKVSGLQLAVEEATTNICSHAYLEEIAINRFSYAYHTTATYEIRLTDSVDSFSVELVDGGIPFNPLSVTPPDITAPIEDRQTDGLGILLMRKMVDDIRYMRESNQNHLTLVVLKKA